MRKTRHWNTTLIHNSAKKRIRNWSFWKIRHSALSGTSASPAPPRHRLLHSRSAHVPDHQIDRQSHRNPDQGGRDYGRCRCLQCPTTFFCCSGIPQCPNASCRSILQYHSIQYPLKPAVSSIRSIADSLSGRDGDSGRRRGSNELRRRAMEAGGAARLRTE